MRNAKKLIYLIYEKTQRNASAGLIVAFNAKNEKTTIITVYDLFGKTIFNISKRNIKSGVNLLDLHMNQLQKGVYLLSLSLDNNNVKVKKVIIE
jgi:hypothetical protein